MIAGGAATGMKLTRAAGRDSDVLLTMNHFILGLPNPERLDGALQHP